MELVAVGVTWGQLALRSDPETCLCIPLCVHLPNLVMRIHLL